MHCTWIEPTTSRVIGTIVATKSPLNHSPCGYCDVYAAVGKKSREKSPVSVDFHLATSVGVKPL